ncbi:molecular chaperone [Providencia rettgeri]|nr:molecular chaperone [Providencia rettgeri]ELR5257039.1 molecular chaperone [Providencia rettgeri]ELT5686928.1 molecular chaperone [Providencia rettgeri]MBX6966779.1 molecular chaperone [Providencia rettgeri]MBX6975069.1 molecular chaperone [Providencia rettgeri]MBX6994063.1 molecular chaperone [Providencia rettgeri]
MKSFICFLLIIFSFSVYSKSIVSGTRLIFDGSKNEATINVSNTGNIPALIQSWIDEGDDKIEPSKINVPFIIPNAMVTLSPDESFSIRVFKKKDIDQYPKDRESLFYLNVVDIPPKPENLKDGSNALIQFVVRSRIKLIYRPSGLSGNANLALGDLNMNFDGNYLVISNPTPFFININDIKDIETKNRVFDSIVIPPFSNKNKIKLNNKSRKISITALNDLGARVEREIIL